jgi:hypothetical protein
MGMIAASPTICGALSLTVQTNAIHRRCPTTKRLDKATPLPVAGKTDGLLVIASLATRLNYSLSRRRHLTSDLRFYSS